MLRLGLMAASIIGLFLVASMAMAQEQSQPTQCPDTSNQLAIDHCIGAQLKAADAALRSIYAKLLSSLGPEQRAHARAAEQAWVKYKTEMCEIVGANREGGSMQGQVVGQCLIAMAVEQAARLSWQVNCPAAAEILPLPGEKCDF